MKNILNKHWPIFIILALTLLISWPLFLPGYFSHHDDLQVMRIFEMRKCLEDFQIPCRWVPDMGYGNGYPLFNYYSVFPYYLGAFLSYFLGFLGAAKALFFIPLILGAVSMYILSKELFGIFGGISAAILYTFAPYRALDTYVRGDVTENFAIAIVPLCFYFAFKLINNGRIKYIFAFSISLGLFLLSHNIMIILFVPILLIFTFYFLISEEWRNLKSLIAALFLGIGLAAFFIIPAYIEKNLVQIENLIRLDLNFRAHFVTINQLFFDRSWGYGSSSPGTNDTISFQIGTPHWWIVIAAFLIILMQLKSRQKIVLPLILISIFLLSLFMTHVKSAFIWEKIDMLKFTQFPWRFLALAIFSASLLGAFLISSLKLRQVKLVAAILIILTILLNWNYFRPDEFYFNLDDKQKLSGILWETQQKAAILDYLPKGAVQPREGAPDRPIVVSGKGEVEGYKVKSNRWQFQVSLDDNTTIEIPVFDFPIWQVFVNREKFPHSNQNYLGRISINFPKNGDFFVEGKFTDTPVRRISNSISLISLAILLGIILYAKYRKNFK